MFLGGLCLWLWRWVLVGGLGLIVVFVGLFVYDVWWFYE